MRRLLIRVLLLAAIAYGYFVWPTPYSYGTWTAQAGYHYLMRKNRITGHIDLYYTPTGRWESVDLLLLNENDRPYVMKP